MSRRYCPWCATDWPILRPCCPADFEHLVDRDAFTRQVIEERMWLTPSQMARITRDHTLPEIGGWPLIGGFVPPDKSTEMDEE